ncbi:MAG: large conductance mechanosensitive channel protein MscL [Lachnospiraceae bacterium]|nr:large conductance mechanosensitive channel protein MscL [Candidatus Colinaster scatohippi]
MKAFMKEFKEFISRGNVMDMAVGVIIGGAFTAIVTALTTSFINPLIALITGGVSIDENGNPVYIGGVFTINGVEFNYGAFISAVINFIIVALIIFLIVKGMNKVVKKKEAAPTTKDCPYCFEKVSLKATKCPHCASELEVK